jgi:hypothetical protein
MLPNPKRGEKVGQREENGRERRCRQDKESQEGQGQGQADRPGAESDPWQSARGRREEETERKKAVNSGWHFSSPA